MKKTLSMLVLVCLFLTLSPALSQAQVEIEFFQQKREAVQTFDVLVAKFNEETEAIRAKQLNVPDGETVLQMRMAMGDAPDVFSHWPVTAPFKVLVAEDYVLDLTGHPALDNVNPDVLDLIKINGKDYALPIALNTMGFFYNMDIFDELGLEVPETYDELISTAKTIKEAGITPFVFSDADAWTINFAAQVAFGLYLPGGEQILLDAMDGKARLTNNADLRAVAEKLLELREYGQSDALGTSYDNATREFANGRAAMFFQGVWAIPSISRANPNLRYEMFPMPGITAEETKVMIGVDTAVAVSAEGSNIEEALSLLEFLGSVEVAQIYTDLDQLPPAILGVQPSQQEYKRLQALIDEGRFFVFPNANWGPEMDDAHGRALQNLLSRKDVSRYLQDLDNIFYNKRPKF